MTPLTTNPYRKLTHLLNQKAMEWSIFEKQDEEAFPLSPDPGEFWYFSEITGDTDIFPHLKMGKKDKELLEALPNLKLMKNFQQVRGEALVIVVDSNMEVKLQTLRFEQIAKTPPLRTEFNDSPLTYGVIMTTDFIKHHLNKSFAECLLEVEDKLPNSRDSLIEETKVRAVTWGEDISELTEEEIYKEGYYDAIMDFFAFFAGLSAPFIQMYADSIGEEYQPVFVEFMKVWEPITHEDNILKDDKHYWLSCRDEKVHLEHTGEPGGYIENLEFLAKISRKRWKVNPCTSHEREELHKMLSMETNTNANLPIPYLPGAVIEMTLRFQGHVTPKSINKSYAYHRLNTFLKAMAESTEGESWALGELLADAPIFSQFPEEEATTLKEWWDKTPMTVLRNFKDLDLDKPTMVVFVYDDLTFSYTIVQNGKIDADTEVEAVLFLTYEMTQWYFRGFSMSMGLEMAKRCHYTISLQESSKEFQTAFAKTFLEVIQQWVDYSALLVGLLAIPTDTAHVLDKGLDLNFRSFALDIERYIFVSGYAVRIADTVMMLDNNGKKKQTTPLEYAIKKARKALSKIAFVNFERK